MNNMIIYSIFLMIFFLIMFSISLNLFYFDLSLLIEWLMFSINSINMEFVLLIDWVSMLFISFVLLISSMVLFYCCSYMKTEKFIDRFLILVILFILSMVLMIISPNLISILFGWDGLGLVSYCLVIYYQNVMSYNSGMLTVLCNRVGDVGLLMAVSMMMMKGSWNYFYMEKMNMLILMILLAAVTKSAQIPFSSWLPSAMAAPTPVSALVHSSTLVTAGVYLMIRFNKFMMEMNMNNLLMFIAVVTMFMAGLMANFENDLKKIIALSTLSQLGLMMMILCTGLKMMAFFHLLTHAIFKSLLFLCAGVIIHSMNNNQDIRYYGNLNEFLPFIMSSFYISSLSLCGFPFLAGFYSKDLIMEVFYYNNINILMLFLSLVSLMFTVSYTLRLVWFVYFGEINMISAFYIKEDKKMNFSMFILLILSILCGSLMSWMFFIDMKLIFLKLDIKILTLFMLMLGLILGIFMYFKNMILLYNGAMFMSSMWFLNMLFSYVYKPYLEIGSNFVMVDKLWIEFSHKNILYIYVKSFISVKLGSMKMFMFIYLFMGFIMLILLFA